MEASDAVRCSRSRNRWRQAVCPLGEDAARQRLACPDPQCPRPGKRVLARGLCAPRRAAAARALTHSFTGATANPEEAPGRARAFDRGRVACQSVCRGPRTSRLQGHRARQGKIKDAIDEHHPSQGARRELPTDTLRADPQRAPCGAAAACSADAVDRRRTAGHAGPGHHASRAAPARAHAAGDSGTAVADGESGTGARAARDAAADGADAACAATRRAEDHEVNEVQLAHRLG